MKKKILILGNGGHSKSCIDIIESTKKFIIAGYVEKNNKAKPKQTNLTLLGYDNDLSKIFKYIKYAHICVGQINNLELRKNLYQKLTNIGFKLPTIISPSSLISKKNVKIEDGSIIMNNVVINSSSLIQSNCIINTGVIIEHDCQIGSHTHIGPGSIINGGVRVGSQCFVGSGSVIRQDKKIKDKKFIKMMSKI